MPRDLVSQIRASHLAAQQQLARSLPEFQIPIGDSRGTMPGYIQLDELVYCYPDVMYPWDPSVIRAVRDFEPTAVPFTWKTVWRKMDYGNRDNADAPLILVRHGVARAVRNPLIPAHEFRCEMPVHDEPGLRSSPHVLADVRPNWLEVFWYDREDRPYGRDVVGGYIPCDTELAFCLRRDHTDNRRAKEISDDLLGRKRRRREMAEKHINEEMEYIDASISKDFSDEPSTPEWKEALFGMPEEDQPAPVVSVPSDVNVVSENPAPSQEV